MKSINWCMKIGKVNKFLRFCNIIENEEEENIIFVHIYFKTMGTIGYEYFWFLISYVCFVNYLQWYIDPRF